MIDKQITPPTSGNHLLDVDQAAALLKDEFGIDKNAEQIRRMARDAKAPFFKLENRPTAAYYIETNDLRTWVWSARNAARKRSAA